MRALVPFVICALLGCGTAQADTLLIDRVQREAPMDMPKRGMSMAEVEGAFGAPVGKDAAVGGGSPTHPPITRWRYAGFAVYFEHDKVLDSVVYKSAALEEGPKDPAKK